MWLWWWLDQALWTQFRPAHCTALDGPFSVPCPREKIPARQTLFKRAMHLAEVASCIEQCCFNRSPDWHFYVLDSITFGGFEIELGVWPLKGSEALLKQHCTARHLCLFGVWSKSNGSQQIFGQKLNQKPRSISQVRAGFISRNLTFTLSRFNLFLGLSSYKVKLI